MEFVKNHKYSHRRKCCTKFGKAWGLTCGMILFLNEAVITFFLEFIAACHDCHWYGRGSEWFRLFFIVLLIMLPRTLSLIYMYYFEHKIEGPSE
jgi:hypothetical protein